MKQFNKFLSLALFAGVFSINVFSMDVSEGREVKTAVSSHSSQASGEKNANGKRTRDSDNAQDASLQGPSSKKTKTENDNAERLIEIERLLAKFNEDLEVLFKERDALILGEPEIGEGLCKRMRQREDQIKALEAEKADLLSQPPSTEPSTKHVVKPNPGTPANLNAWHQRLPSNGNLLSMGAVMVGIYHGGIIGKDVYWNQLCNQAAPAVEIALQLVGAAVGGRIAVAGSSIAVAAVDLTKRFIKAKRKNTSKQAENKTA